MKSLEGIEGFNKEAFEKIHAAGEQVTSIRINPKKFSIFQSPFSILNNIPWSSFGFYLQQRPSFTFDPLFHAGCYYVQEASGMFLEQAFKQLIDLSQPIKVLDLCAAPGGKSTHIQSVISSESLLVSNEVIKSRSNILVDNIIKWGAENVIVTSNDPVAFQKLEGFFDVLVIDAPCSGSGLFRKDEEAITEWSLTNVHLCSQRQQRIIADALPALKKNGLLIYSTCSYSKEEDEDIAGWIVTEFGMENLKLKIDDEWNIVTTTSPGIHSESYRFYPDKLKGEGFFLSCFRKIPATKEIKIRSSKTEPPTAKERKIIQSWLETGIELIKEANSFFALPHSLVNYYGILNSVLNIRYKGIGIGQVMKDRLVPDHSLALSKIISGTIPVNELPYEEAIKYLQKKELNFNTSKKGWQLVCYKGHNLGWVNSLPNRINNYYPKEFRILKQTNDTSFEK